MRTLLKHAPTGQYFQSLEKWTADPSAAHDFGHMARALKFVEKAGFTNMELIVSFEDHDECPQIRERSLSLALGFGPQTAWSQN